MGIEKLMSRLPLKILLTRKWLRGYETVWLLYKLCDIAIPIEELFRLIKEHNIPFYAYSHELCRDLKSCYEIDFNDDFDNLEVVLEDGSLGYVPHNELIKMPLSALVSVELIDPPESGMRAPALRTSYIPRQGAVFSSVLLSTSQETEWKFNSDQFLNAPRKDFSHTGHIYFAKRDIHNLAEMINSGGQRAFTDASNENLMKQIVELEAENATLRKTLEESTEQPKKSTFLMIARTLELYLEANPKHKQKNFVAQLQDGQKSIRGLSDATVNQILADAKKVLAEERKR